MSTGIIDLNDRETYHNSAKGYKVGTMGRTSDGRIFRYALEGGNAINASLLCEGRATDATWDTIVIATTTKASDTKISVTDQSDTIAKDELENGYLVCETDPSTTGPNCWRIAGNDAVAGTNDFNIYLAEGATIGQVLTASTDTMIFSFSPWSKVIVSPVSAQTSIIVGVTMLQISANNYCWLQTRGICGVAMDNQDAAAAIGEGLVSDDQYTAGNIVNVTDDAQRQVVAQTITVQALTNGNIIPVFLTIE